MKTSKCRISGDKLTTVVDLGNLYVSNFCRDATTACAKGPLVLGLGSKSGLLQLLEPVDPDLMYRQYWYRSGTNSTMRKQLADIVNVIPNWIRLKNGDIVLDIGCNDGTLLSLYPAGPKIIKVGIDPAANLADEGRRHCDLHACDYFSKRAFSSLTAGSRAKVITSIAMFYDLDDPHGFVDDIVGCLADDGVWIVQASYTPLMLAQNAFDNICHEHIEYYTLLSVEHLLRPHGLKIVDVELNDTNSGSFRLTIARQTNELRQSNLFYKELGRYRFESLLSYEKVLRLNEPEVYMEFVRRIERQKKTTMELLRDLRKQGKKIYGYGASTKGNTLLQYYGIGPDLITAIAERQAQKVGLMTAGSWIPIISEEEMRAASPDFLFVLPWQFINEFCEREASFLKGGGKFIVPLPELQIIGAGVGHPPVLAIEPKRSSRRAAESRSHIVR